MPTLLDAYCGAGGCSAGYAAAGFEVTGVDIRPQPHYPFRLIQGDAIEYIREHGREYDAIHASPPCQGYSVTKHATGVRGAPRLIDATRDALRATGRPYVIENVEGAAPEMSNFVLLCGTMFGLRVRRHRLFEISPILPILTSPCSCRNGVIRGDLVGQRVAGKVAPRRTKPPHHTEADRREAIGVPWMTTMEARQAIPPAYTEFVGAHLIQALALEAAS